jgi:hypothetical protein
MKQYHITSEHVNLDSNSDCVLSQEDPIHELKIAHYLNGLGSAERLAEYRLQMSRLRSQQFTNK